MGKGQIIASALISLSILILIGYAVGDFVLRAKSVSNAPIYNSHLSDVVINSERIKTLLSQERSYSIDEVLIELAWTGGYGEKIGTSRIMTLNEKYIPQKQVPYYTDEIPSFSEIKSNLMDKIEKQLITPNSLKQINLLYGEDYLESDVDLHYVSKNLEFEEDENTITVLWFETSGNPIIIEKQISSIPGAMVEYQILKEIETKRTTPFQALYDAAKKYVENNELGKIIQEKTENVQTITAYRKIGGNCVGTTCPDETVSETNAELEFFDALSSSEENKYRLLYCDLMKEQVNCNDAICDYTQRNPCLMACYDYELSGGKIKTYVGCNTPQTRCDNECKNEETLDIEYQFRCVCDDWEKDLQGRYVCENAGWYSKAYSRVYTEYEGTPTVIMPVQESIQGVADYLALGYGKMKDEDICLRIPYDNDGCCMQQLEEIPETCDLTNLGAESQCQIINCEYLTDDDQCVKDTVETLTGKKLSDDLKDGSFVTRKSAEYYYYPDTEPYAWTINSKIIGAEDAQMEINPGTVLSKTFFADCESCKQGDPSTIIRQATMGIQDLKETFQTACGEYYDPCQCYEEWTIAEKSEDPEIMGQTCLYYYIKKINPAEYSLPMEFKQESDSSAMPEADTNIIIFSGKPCITNYDCDYDLEDNGLKSVCVNNACKYCDETLDTDPDTMLDQVYEDSSYIRRYCDPDTNTWYKTTKTDGETCTNNSDCIPVRIFGDYPGEAICAEIVNMDYEYVTCLDRRICETCPSGYDLYKNDCPVMCTCVKTILTSGCKKCGVYESAMRLIQKSKDGSNYQCTNLEWGIIKETKCSDGIDNDGNGKTDCADPNCASLYCGMNPITKCIKKCVSNICEETSNCFEIYII